MIEISNVIYKFANCFDLKDWATLKSLLCEEIICDYKGLRGKTELLSPGAYVESRIYALQALKTQHLFSNLEIYYSDIETNCRCQAYILRSNDQDYFNTHAIYQFTLVPILQSWKIGKIKQDVLWNEGNSNIHKGIK